jgi:hypothetical protein
MKQLTAPEKKHLALLESVIDAGKGTFISVGEALLEIKETKLYRETHRTFEAYCAARHGISKRHGNRLIVAAQVVQNVGPIGPALNESQCRELAKLPAAEQLDAARQAGAEASAKKLREIVEKKKEQIAKDEREALSLKPSFDRPSRDRHRAIRSHIEKAIKLIDGSIEHADRLEAKLRDALEVLDSSAAIAA